MRNRILEQDIKEFCRHLDIDMQVDFVREYEKIGDSELYGGKHCGSDSEHKGSEFIAEKLKEIGLENVEMVPCKTARYQFNDAVLSFADETAVIRPYGYVSPGTGKEGITAEIADAGKATKDDCEAANLKGKIAMFGAMGTLDGTNLSGQMEQAILCGASAILIYAVDDVLNDETIRVQPPNIISTVPIVGICKRDADFIKNKIQKGRCMATLRVDADFEPFGGTTYNVVGEIPGRFSEEKIVYTAHLDHYFRCLQDNISTCSTLLGIAKAMIESGYRPNRTIIFAFHGSHETGGSDTRYPYIYGSYKLTHEGKKEWTGKAVADINFEYTALRMNKLHALAFLAVNRLASSYFEYSPELTGKGFKEKEKNFSPESYSMFSWSDCISYHTAGIPTICNDPVSEQFIYGTGDYVGRDHSNFDNWDIFDVNILEDTGRFFGGMGIYIDSLPYIPIDYTEQADRIRNEVNRESLEKLGISSDRYFEAVNELGKEAEAFNKFVEKKNTEFVQALSEGMADDDKKEWFDKGRLCNKKALEAFKIITDEIDKINSYDFLCLATVKYMQNTEMLMAAKEFLEAGNMIKVFETILPVDLAAASYYFDEAVAEHMRKEICAPEYIDRRTWAANRELNVFTHYELINKLKGAESEEDLKQAMMLLDEAIKREAGYIQPSMNDEINCIEKVKKCISEAIV